jgi:hypothetical protein
LALLLAPGVARAAPPWARDPDWPCQQLLVPKLAAAAYWNGKRPANLGDWRSDPEVAALVRQIAPRQISTEDGLAAIASFARGLSGDRSVRLALAFSGLLDMSNRERSGLIEKLKEIGRRQRELTVLVARLATQLKAIPPDATGEVAAQRIDLQQRHDFTEMNFEDIQHTIRYACELPVEIDARLGAWARALQAAGSQSKAKSGAAASSP